MDIDKLNSIVLRVFFAGAFLFLIFGGIEKALNMVGQNFPGINVFPIQLLHWAVVLLVFVIALLLRQIREELRKR